MIDIDLQKLTVHDYVTSLHNRIYELEEIVKNLHDHLLHAQKVIRSDCLSKCLK